MCVCVERINIYLFIYLFTPRPTTPSYIHRENKTKKDWFTCTALRRETANFRTIRLRFVSLIKPEGWLWCGTVQCVGVGCHHLHTLFQRIVIQVCPATLAALGVV